MEGTGTATETTVDIAANGMMIENTESAKMVIGRLDSTRVSTMTTKQLLRDEQRGGTPVATRRPREAIIENGETALDLEEALARSYSRIVQAKIAGD
jgi:hypothetical protein